VASTHLAKYVVLAVKFPVGAVVVTVAAKLVYQVKVPVAQLRVMLTGLPAQIGLEAKTGESGIGFTETWKVSEHPFSIEYCILIEPAVIPDNMPEVEIDAIKGFELIQVPPWILVVKVVFVPIHIEFKPEIVGFAFTVINKLLVFPFESV
jgi:hypothetical protein